LSQRILKNWAISTSDFATGSDARREIGRTATVRPGLLLCSRRAQCALKVDDGPPDENPDQRLKMNSAHYIAGRRTVGET
jgi:hypothetical protein